MTISQTHYRSISLPSRLHSISTNFETHLESLKSFEVSANSEAIQSGLLMIAELYNSVGETTQSQHKSTLLLEEKPMEESLSGSVELLDYCSGIKETLQMMKENVQALQSAFRRKGTDSSVQNDVALYFTCRKRMNKCIAKTLKTLNKSQHHTMKSGSNVSVNADDNNFTSVLRALKGVAIAILKSVLMFLFSPMGGWSKKVMMIAKSGRGNDDDEVGNVELYLQKMRSFDGFRVLDVQKKLHNLEAVVEGFEGGLDRLFRQLVRVRVTLLNIFTDY